MRNLSKIKNNSGITVVEVLISAAVLLIFIGAMSSVYTTFITVSSNGTENIKSYYLAEEGVEAIKTLRNESWSSGIETLSTTTTYYLSWSGSVWQATSVEQALDGFYRTFSITDAFRDGDDDLAQSGTFDPNTRKVQVDVAWWDGSATSTRSIETYITNIFDN